MSATAIEAPRASSGGWRRRGGRAGIVLVLVLAAGGALAWFGMLPWHAPLDIGPYGSTLWMRTTPGRPTAYNTLWLTNGSRAATTMTGVNLATDVPGLRIVDAWFPADTPACLRWAVGNDAWQAPATCKVAVSGFVIPAQTHEERRLIVVVTGARAGVYRSPGFDIHYRVGPIPYSTTYDAQLVLTVVRPGG